MTVFSLAAYGLSVLFAAPVLGFFAPQDSHVFELVLANFGYFALSLLLLCPNMFAAYLFTAMGDGKRAAIVSFCSNRMLATRGRRNRSVVCRTACRASHADIEHNTRDSQPSPLRLRRTTRDGCQYHLMRQQRSLKIRLWKPFRKKYSAIRFCKSLHRRQKCLLKSVLFLFLCLEI